MRYTKLILALSAVLMFGCSSAKRYVLHSPLTIELSSGEKLVLPPGTYIETSMIKGHQVEVMAFGTSSDSAVEEAGDRQ